MVRFGLDLGMRRVLVVGSGIDGLVTAVKNHLDGNQVIILEKRSTIGGRGTSSSCHGFQLEHGPHLLLKGGPLHKMVKKVSRVKLSLRPIRPQKIQIVGHGLLWPINSPRTILAYKRGEDPIRESAMKLISSWGLDIPNREKALLNGNLCVVGEGWAGIIGRLASTLEEVGVPIQTKTEVTEVIDGGVLLSTGVKVEADEVHLCRGSKNSDSVIVSTLDVVLDYQPLDGLHGLVDGDVAILDLAAIHSGKAPGMSHLSCISLNGGLEAIESLLDERLSGWRSHILVKRENKKIILSGQRKTLSDGLI